MKEIFNNYIATSFNNNFEQSKNKLIQFEINYSNLLPPNKNSYLLDIGVGRGEMLTCIKNHEYKNYLGIDISEDLIKFCKNLNLNCEKVDNTTEWLQQNKNKYDLITLFDVLEHIKKEEVINLLVSLRNALNENGILVIQTPNLQAFEGQLHRYNDYTHEFGFTEHSLYQILVTTSFSNQIIFKGFEYIIKNGLKQKIQKILRSLIWSVIKKIRLVTGNLCSGKNEIMHPVFYCIVKK